MYHNNNKCFKTFSSNALPARITARALFQTFYIITNHCKILQKGNNFLEKPNPCPPKKRKSPSKSWSISSEILINHTPQGKSGAMYYYTPLPKTHMVLADIMVRGSYLAKSYFHRMGKSQQDGPSPQVATATGGQNGLPRPSALVRLQPAGAVGKVS